MLVTSANYRDGYNACISAYDSVGGQAFSGTITVYLDTEDLSTDSNFFTLSSGNINVNFKGYALLSYCVTLGNDTSARSQGQAWMEHDQGAGFQEVLGTRGRSYHHNASHESTAISSTRVVTVDAGDVFRLRAGQMTGGPLVTLAGQSSVTIMRIK